MTSSRYLLNDILTLDSRFRRNFMNSVEGFKNVVLVGTMNKNKETNLAIFNSVVHVGATPPLVGFIHRPVTVPKQTFANIESEGYFTINLIHDNMVEKAHQTSARYEPGESEFTETGLTPEWSTIVPAPYVKESFIKMGLSLQEIIPIKTNGTYLIIGQVEELFVPDECVGADGFVHLSKASTVACAGLDSYYLPEPLSRLEYAKPGLPVRRMNG
jgi:flavin reductase (DIM6/NTAB) family NADH-FMN oxidoreductase RutF